ncbi:MAG: CpsB/CapC family capsule biosynthesis tyrosine phosphatase [Gemmatimonadaceae bacterium]
MIDIHSHLLPGVDDGSPSLAVSVPVLTRMKAEGVTAVVCTPHWNASRAATAPVADYQERLALLKAAVPEGPALHLGFEILLDAPGVDLSMPGLTLAGTRALLVEFSRGPLPPGATAELRRLVTSGFVPVVTHPERYLGCTLEMVQSWRAFGVVIQVEARALERKGQHAVMARAMLADGLIDLVASDNHGDDRSIAAVRDWMIAHGGQVQAELLTRLNPDRLLSGRSLDPVPAMATSAMDRVRRLFGG